MKRLLSSLLIAGVLSMTACGNKPTETMEETNTITEERIQPNDAVETVRSFSELTEEQIELFRIIAEKNLYNVVLEGSSSIEAFCKAQEEELELHSKEGLLPGNAAELFEEWKASVDYYELLETWLLNNGLMDAAEVISAKIPDKEKEAETEQQPGETEQQPEETAATAVETEQVVQEQTTSGVEANDPTQAQAQEINTVPEVPQQSAGIIGNGYDSEGYAILSADELYQIYGQYSRPAIEDNWLADLIKEEHQDNPYLENLLKPKYINQIEIQYLTTGNASGKLTVSAEDVGMSFEDSFKQAMVSEVKQIVENYGVSYETAYEYVEKDANLGDTDIHNAAIALLDKQGQDHQDDYAYTEARRMVNLTLDQKVTQAMEQGVSFEAAYANALYEIAGIQPSGQ